MKKDLLTIENLSVNLEDKNIINNLNLEIKKNEIHVIMGPNGSGKSTLSKTIMGHPKYKIQSGNIFFENEDIKNKEIYERTKKGIFLVFQSPREIEGINMKHFLHSISKQNILNQNNITIKEARKNKELRSQLSLVNLQKKIKTISDDLDINKDFLKRELNHGFSGGEKKKSEVMQMEILQPKLSILDEIDSGLDIDALKIVCQKINQLKEKNGMSLLLITHHSKILNYIKPDYIHIFANGNIKKTGTQELVNEIENKGYKDFIND